MSHAPPEIIALAEALPTAGAVVYWRLEGPLDVAALAATWGAAGLPETLLPSTPTPAAALSRAVHEQAKGRVLVRPLQGKKGFALVQEHAAGDDLDHRVDLRVRLDAIGRPTFSTVGTGAASAWTLASGCSHPAAAVVAAAYEKHLHECDTDDVGPWLVRLATSFLDGLNLRGKGGGMYFVPPAHVRTWDLIATCLRETSGHAAFKFPAMRGADAVAAVLDAVEQEAKGEFDEMMAEVSSAEGALGERALHGRYDRVEEMERKVKRYEKLLGTRVESFAARLEELQAALAAAMLKAAAVEERAG